MEDVRKQDPCFTNFVPRTAAEAVDRYGRCRKNGLKPMLVPECLIASAVGLRGVELDQFESWIINPNEDLNDVELVPTDTIRKYNEKIYLDNVARVMGPPLPAEDDEKAPDDIMKLAGQVRDSLALSRVAPCSTPST